mmetsp:Transcript_21616/g.66065  ORF Transcript_21616/g.66065 Transcript_21616/m.66065 type:complete len:205 (-) Transcript_21616:1083-1697(-)
MPSSSACTGSLIPTGMARCPRRSSPHGTSWRPPPRRRGTSRRDRSRRTSSACSTKTRTAPSPSSSSRRAWTASTRTSRSTRSPAWCETLTRTATARSTSRSSAICSSTTRGSTSVTWTCSTCSLCVCVGGCVWPVSVCLPRFCVAARVGAPVRFFCVLVCVLAGSYHSDMFSSLLTSLNVNFVCPKLVRLSFSKRAAARLSARW